MGMDVPTCPVCGEPYRQGLGTWGCPTSKVCRKVLKVMIEIQQVTKKLEEVEGKK